jgi:flavin-binding protein dodecin
MRNGNAHRVKEITMTTTMRIINSTTGEIWERETKGLVSALIIKFIYQVLDNANYTEDAFDDLVDRASDTMEKINWADPTEPCCVGITVAITNYKYDRYETYRIEAERG